MYLYTFHMKSTRNHVYLALIAIKKMGNNLMDFHDWLEK